MDTANKDPQRRDDVNEQRGYGEGFIPEEVPLEDQPTPTPGYKDAPDAANGKTARRDIERVVKKEPPVTTLEDGKTRPHANDLHASRDAPKPRF